jgi:hypothetical protein
MSVERRKMVGGEYDFGFSFAFFLLLLFFFSISMLGGVDGAFTTQTHTF